MNHDDYLSRWSNIQRLGGPSWRDGAPLREPITYRSHGGTKPVTCHNVGDVLLAVALDPEAPTFVDAVDLR